MKKLLLLPLFLIPLLLFQNERTSHRAPASVEKVDCVSLISKFAESMKDPHYIWTGGPKQDFIYNAEHHFEKHKAEFPELETAMDYVMFAHDFMEHPPEGTLIRIKHNGDKYFYHPESEIFGVMTEDNIPRTLFRPNPAKHKLKDNLEYFNRQFQ